MREADIQALTLTTDVYWWMRGDSTQEEKRVTLTVDSEGYWVDGPEGRGANWEEAVTNLEDKFKDLIVRSRETLTQKGLIT